MDMENKSTKFPEKSGNYLILAYFKRQRQTQVNSWQKIIYVVSLTKKVLCGKRAEIDENTK